MEGEDSKEGKSRQNLGNFPLVFMQRHELSDTDQALLNVAGLLMAAPVIGSIRTDRKDFLKLSLGLGLGLAGCTPKGAESQPALKFMIDDGRGGKRMNPAAAETFFRQEIREMGPRINLLTPVEMLGLVPGVSLASGTSNANLSPDSVSVRQDDIKWYKFSSEWVKGKPFNIKVPAEVAKKGQKEVARFRARTALEQVINLMRGSQFPVFEQSAQVLDNPHVEWDIMTPDEAAYHRGTGTCVIKKDPPANCCVSQNGHPTADVSFRVMLNQEEVLQKINEADPFAIAAVLVHEVSHAIFVQWLLNNFVREFKKREGVLPDASLFEATVRHVDTYNLITTADEAYAYWTTHSLIFTRELLRHKMPVGKNNNLNELGEAVALMRKLSASGEPSPWLNPSWFDHPEVWNPGR